ncbi:hypothetical protein BJ742DRAFT_854336 [Cladochytrium replicatum]|nr:hypothetical protein BJ742DRAFT_854336 [Cladochytrium replicatum]
MTLAREPASWEALHGNLNKSVVIADEIRHDPLDESVYALVPDKQKSKPSIYAQAPKKAVSSAAEKPGRADRVKHANICSPNKATAPRVSSSKHGKKTYFDTDEKADSYEGSEDNFETEEGNSDDSNIPSTNIDTAFHSIKLAAGSRIPTIPTGSGSTSSQQRSARPNNLEAHMTISSSTKAVTPAQPNNFTGPSGPSTAELANR